MSSTAAYRSIYPFIASLLPCSKAFVHNRIESYLIFVQDEVMYKEHGKTAGCILPIGHNMAITSGKLRKLNRYEVLL